jgi:hypothetical protein
MNNFIRIGIEVSVQSAALALCVGGILAAARIRSGAVRHAAWLAVLCGMMLMPLLSRVTPRVEVPITLPAMALTEVPSADQAVQLLSVRATGMSRTVLLRHYGAALSGSQSVSAPIPWTLIGLVVYAAGLLFLLAGLVPGWRVASQIARSCVLVPVPFSITRTTVYESSLVNTPLTVGLLAPRIVLPLSWREWTGTKLHAVLAHEAAHVGNRDALVNLAAYLNRCVFWFHPLSWWLEKKLAITAEHACDEAAARAVGDGKKYARVLLDVAAVICPRRRRYALVSAGMRGDGGLEERIDRILRDDAVRVVSPTRKAIVAVACATAIVAIPACRQASAPKSGKAPTLMPEVLALMGARNTTDPAFQRRLEEVGAKLGQSNDVTFLVSNGQALVNRFSPMPKLGADAFETGRFAISRALKLDPRSSTARQAQVSEETRLLMSSRWNPDDSEARKRLAYINGELSQSGDVNFLISTATPMVSMQWPTTHGMAAGAEIFAVGKAAIQRALKLNPNSVWARQLMVKVHDQELVVSLPANIWSGPPETRHRAIQALPNGERFREMSILAATAGDDAMRAIRMSHDSDAWTALWVLAGTYAQEALTIAPQAKDYPDYGTSLFRANMVAGMSALVGGDKAAAMEFARKAMDAPPTEALRYPIVNARPWSNWHYPHVLVAKLLREGDREAAADVVEQYSHLLIADKDGWVADLATIRKGGTPAWVQ